MGAFLYLFVIGVFMCWLSIHNASCDPLVFKFEINSINNIQVNPQLAKTIARINTEMYVEYNANDKNSFLVALRNTQIIIDKADGNSAPLNKCFAMARSNLSLLKPFGAVFEGGDLQYLTAYKAESELSVNLKLHLMYILQIKESPLAGTSPTVSVNEPIYFGGSCPVNYTIEVKNQTDSQFIRVQRDYDMKFCSDLKNVDRSGVNYLKNICRNDPQLEWNRQINASMIQTAEGLYADTWSLAENIKFLPWVNSSKEADIKTLMTIKNVPGNYSKISPLFPNIGTVNASEFWYRDVKIPIFKENNKQDLPTTYRALACQSKPQNLLMDIYEKAINCWKIF